jgi:type VI secretion system protein ImpC
LQYKLNRVRRPRVQITYDADIGNAIMIVQLPFIMGVLADLSGTRKEPLPEVSARKFIEIDIDNFNNVMKSVQPRVTFAVPNELTGEGELRIDLTFESMDDFSPGVIASKIPASNKSLKSGNPLFEQINSILHHAEFQKLESAWRGLYFLVNNTETREMLKIRVLNISKADLAATLKKFKGAAWDRSPIFKKLYEEVYGRFGVSPYGCLVGDYYFDHSPPDVELLGEMSRISAAIHAPFITGGSPTVMQMDSWQELGIPRDLSKIFQAPEYDAWRFLRDSEDSRYISLTLPRFLARLPYGPETNPVKEFDFEEDTNGADLSRYIWANCAYAMATNINRSFQIYGWCTQIRGVESGGAVEGLPVHTFLTDDGSGYMKRSTEIVISDRREFELEENGFMPLIQLKDPEIAVFYAVPSLHKPAAFINHEDTISECLMAKLPYLFACCSIVQYMKCVVRDRIDSFVSLTEMKRFLDIWISRYIAGPTDTTEHDKARKPLAAAEVILEEVQDSSGFVNATLYLRPYYQLEDPKVALPIVTKLPLPESLRSGTKQIS